MLFNTPTPHDIKIADYTYNLPDECIAKYPLEERDNSKLLVFKNNSIEDSSFKKLPDFLNPNDLLVFNNTKVIPARLIFFKPTGAQIEIFCLEPVNPPDYALSLQSNKCTWKCIVGNLKKWKEASLNKILIINGNEISLKAEKQSEFSTSINIEFSWDNPTITFDQIISITGKTPIPPYLNRESEEIDNLRYQTIYSSVKGSVAAPTAGLHFTDNVFNRLKNKNISTAELTLHVGAGTFKPVQSEKLSNHEMHTEYFVIRKKVLELLYKHNGNVVSVGTTTLRTLESLYWIAAKLKTQQKPNNVLTVSQWDPYELKSNIGYNNALEILINYLEKSNATELIANTQILIAPGYQVKSIKALITNFHQPQSTLLLLVASIVGNKWKDIYEFAFKNHYRFLSYGDSSILFL